MNPRSARACLRERVGQLIGLDPLYRDCEACRSNLNAFSDRNRRARRRLDDCDIASRLDLAGVGGREDPVL
ncbi:hypothetical protein [Sphingomonas daechungensis]|uniref:hypothetical protein n=1 Tax=Sphingomonas daechungensis TaxID=1176646 RepID=UPI001CB96065|nr:hypothetical protein [Sphingomonas daechungensis]